MGTATLVSLDLVGIGHLLYGGFFLLLFPGSTQAFFYGTNDETSTDAQTEIRQDEDEEQKQEAQEEEDCADTKIDVEDSMTRMSSDHRGSSEQALLSSSQRPSSSWDQDRSKMERRVVGGPTKETDTDCSPSSRSQGPPSKQKKNFHLAKDIKAAQEDENARLLMYRICGIWVTFAGLLCVLACHVPLVNAHTATDSTKEEQIRNMILFGMAMIMAAAHLIEGVVKLHGQKRDGSPYVYWTQLVQHFIIVLLLVVSAGIDSA